MDLSQVFKNYSVVYMKKYLFILIILLIVGIKFWNKYIIGIALLPLLFLIYFFRIPKHIEERNAKFATAPAYGKVIKVQEKDGLLQIAIFINLWDAHIQYMPYDGIIKKQIYKEGQFNPAYLFAKGKYNEKLIHNISTNKGMITVVQIAGVVARTIERFVQEGQAVQQNDEIGLIRFGSRCDIFIPLNNTMKVLVKEGDRVKGGITKIVEFLN
jgi:phosphatidylserine decarboxylase